MALFDCCKNCKPPKRSLCCHDNCEEYLQDKHTKDELRRREHVSSSGFNIHTNGTMFTPRKTRKY